MKIYLNLFFFIGFAFMISNCAPTRFVTPLKKGEWAGGINIGGPLINFAGATIPVPFSSLYAGYGHTDRTTLYSGIHTTSLAFQTFQLDLGANYLLRKMQGNIPGISLNTTVNTMLDFREYNFRAYPSLTANLFYDLKYGRFYAGMDNWFDLFPNAVPDNSIHHAWVPAFHVGQAFKYQKWELNFEYKNLAPYTDNSDIVVQYAKGNGKGAHGLYLTLQRRF